MKKKINTDIKFMELPIFGECPNPFDQGLVPTPEIIEMMRKGLRFKIMPGWCDATKSVVMIIPSEVFDDYDYVKCFGILYKFIKDLFKHFEIERIRHRSPEKIGGPLALHGTFSAMIKIVEDE